VAAWFDAANESELQQPGCTLLQQVLLDRAGCRDSGGVAGEKYHGQQAHKHAML
jgi:hypothetical protein